MLERVLEILRSARQRKAMYLMTIDAAAAENFLNGFNVACFACGLDVPLDIKEQATVERGWTWLAARPIAEMKARGLNEEAIVDELFAIEIAGFETWSERRD
jgi:predicted metal-dependent phosphotriesterase family hydrolase